MSAATPTVEPPAPAATPDLQSSVSKLFDSTPAPAQATPAPAAATKPQGEAATGADPKAAGAPAKKGVLGALQQKPAAAPAKADGDATAPDLDDDKATEGWSEPAKANWKTFRQKHREEIARLQAAAEKERQDREALAAKYNDYDAVLQREKEYAQKLAILDFRNSPEFAEKFVKPKQHAREEMQQALTLAGKQADIGAVMALPLAERIKAANELVKDLPPLSAQMFTAAFSAYGNNERAESDAIAHHETLKQEWEREQLAKRQKEREVDKALFSETADSIFSAFPPAEVEDSMSDAEKAQVKAYNDGLAQARKEAETVAFGALDAKGLAQASIHAALGKFASTTVIPGLVETINSLTSQRDALQAKLDAIAKAKPGYSEGGSETPAQRETLEQAVRRVYAS